MNEEKIKFGDFESSSRGWKMGDNVTHRSDGSVWRRGVIMLVKEVPEDKAKIVGRMRWRSWWTSGMSSVHRCG